MKDSEFIELLNLYLDHEISPADAARLEAEVLANPQRRRIYQEYCRIQKGCQMLAQEFQTESVPATGGSVIAFEAAAPVRRSRVSYVAGGMAAAAACLALGFLTWNRTPGTNTQNHLAGQTPVIAVENQVAIAPAAMTTERTIGPTVTLASQRLDSEPVAVGGLRLDQSGAGKADLLSLATGPASPQFDWMRAVQFTPIKRIPIDEFRYDARPLSPARGGSPQLLRQTTEEMNATRFTR